MSRTVAESSAAYRKRRADKMARYEAALREILAIACPRIGEDPFAVMAKASHIARKALNGSARDD